MLQKIYLSTLLCLFLTVPAIAQEAGVKTTLSTPENVTVGVPIKFSVSEPETGDIIKWEILQPRGEETTTFNTVLGIEYFVDTGCSYKGTVEVLCTVINFDSQKFIQEVLSCEVEGSVVPPEPTPPTPPVPDWESKVTPDKFDDLGIRIDTLVRDLGGLSRRNELAENFFALHQDIETFKIKTPNEAVNRISTFAPAFDPEWKPVFDMLREDGSKRSPMVWTDVSNWYECIGFGIRGAE